MQLTNKKYAVLIDMENVSQSYAEGIFQELSNYGDTPIRRIYGNFEAKNDWHDACVKYSLKTIHQINNTKGKNASDSSLIIDAMDILYRDSFIDGFVLVSSDSDFTGLARRIRESSKEVIGMGEKKTPDSLVKSCSIFKYLETLLPSDANQGVIFDMKELSEEIKEIVAEKNGKIYISQLKEQLIKRDPSFDEKNYGFNQMIKLLTSIKDLQIECIDGNPGYVSFDEKAKTHDKSSMDAEAVNIIKSNKKKIKLSFLSQALIDKGYNYKVFGYSNFKKYIQSIDDIEIDEDDCPRIKTKI